MAQLVGVTDLDVLEREKTKPCPFCGAKSDLSFDVLEVLMFGSGTVYRITCNLCGGCGGNGETRTAAINKWNQRKTARKRNQQ
jgi:Lar family restriction alleviation protein